MLTMPFVNAKYFLWEKNSTIKE